jgi:hypothetical protein
MSTVVERECQCAEIENGCVLKEQGYTQKHAVRNHARLDVFAAVKIQVDVFGVVTKCSDVVGYQGVAGPCRPRVQDGGRKVFRNVGTQLQHYTTSQLIRHQRSSVK